MNQLREKVAYGIFEENKTPEELLSAASAEINALQ
jgi:hypothetical protein